MQNKNITVGWYVPKLIDGSGGHRTIFAMANTLQSRNLKTIIFLENSLKNPSKEVFSKFGFTFNEVYSSWRDDIKVDIAIATIWYSAPFVTHLNCNHKFYFVQDYEAYFHNLSDAYLMAENTYKLDLKIITMGKWLSHKLCGISKTPCIPIEFGVDKSIYFNSKKDESLKPSICFINQPDKPRRCSRLGIEALGIFKHNNPEVDIYLYGSPPPLSKDVWFEHKNLGLINIRECAKLYNHATLGLCISSTNPSRIPFEMMATGLPTVDIYRENNLFDYPDDTITLADQTPESIAEALQTLISSPELRKTRSQKSEIFMTRKTQNSESKQFADAVINEFNGKTVKTQKIARTYFLPPIKGKLHISSHRGYQKKDSKKIINSLYSFFIRLLPNTISKFIDRYIRLAWRWYRRN